MGSIIRYHEFIVKACEVIAQARTRDLMGEPVPCRKFALLVGRGELVIGLVEMVLKVPEKFGCRSYLDASDLLFKNKISYTLEVKRVVQDEDGLEGKATPPRRRRKRQQRSAIMERWSASRWNLCCAHSILGTSILLLSTTNHQMTVGRSPLG